MNVLFIGPVFYDYHNLIKKKIEVLGASVSFFSEKKNGLLFGILNNINPYFIFIYQKYYYWTLLKRIRNQRFTHFFLIRGYKIPDFFLKELRLLNPGIKFIMYQWDSNKNNSYFHLLKYFDKSYTFDYKDYKCCGDAEKLGFLQLFYTEEISNLKNKLTDIKYDFFCFSSFTLSRYYDMLSFIKYCEDNKYRLKSFCFIPFSTYFRFKYLRRIPLNKELLSFKSMPKETYIKFLDESEVIVDFSHATQTGLSMKVIEAFGAGKKILTTNNSILDNPIYHPDWVQLVDPSHIETPRFTKKEETKADENLYIDNWINELFN